MTINDSIRTEDIPAAMVIGHMLNVQFVKDSLISTVLIAIMSGYVLTIGSSINWTDMHGSNSYAR
jgi:hypothetical protein